MCRGGGGNKSLHYKKKVQSSFHFFFQLISENILSVPHIIFVPCKF